MSPMACKNAEKGFNLKKTSSLGQLGGPNVGRIKCAAALAAPKVSVDFFGSSLF